jgi:hypothetical protein
MQTITGPTGNTFYRFSETTKNELLGFADQALERIDEPKLSATVEDIADKIDTFGQLSIGQFRALNRASKATKLELPVEVQEFLRREGQRVLSRGTVQKTEEPTKPTADDEHKETFMRIVNEIGELLWETKYGKA